MWPLLAIPITAFFIKLKVSKETSRAIDEGSEEFRQIVKNGMTRALFASLIKWFLYLALIFSASNIARGWHVSAPLAVALAIVVFIYSFYAYMIYRCAKWYIEVCKNGAILNPFKLLYVYIYHEIYLKVSDEIRREPAFRQAALLVFGPSREKMARQITEKGMSSADLWLDVALRVLLWLIGWGAYCMVYKNVFLFATGIEFEAWWQPLVWPLATLYGLAAQCL